MKNNMKNKLKTLWNTWSIPVLYTGLAIGGFSFSIKSVLNSSSRNYVNVTTKEVGDSLKVYSNYLLGSEDDIRIKTYFLGTVAKSDVDTAGQEPYSMYYVTGKSNCYSESEYNSVRDNVNAISGQQFPNIGLREKRISEELLKIPEYTSISHMCVR